MFLPREELIDKTGVSSLHTVLNNVSNSVDHLLIGLWIFWQIYSEKSYQRFRIDPFDHAIVTGRSIEHGFVLKNIDDFSHKRFMLFPNTNRSEIFDGIAHF